MHDYSYVPLCFMELTPMKVCTRLKYYNAIIWYIYPEIGLTVFNYSYLLVSMFRIAALGRCMIITTGSVGNVLKWVE